MRWLTVAFTDNLAGLDGDRSAFSRWTFGDGRGGLSWYTEENPTYTYTSAGVLG